MKRYEEIRGICLNFLKGKTYAKLTERKIYRIEREDGLWRVIYMDKGYPFLLLLIFIFLISATAGCFIIGMVGWMVWWMVLGGDPSYMLSFNTQIPPIAGFFDVLTYSSIFLFFACLFYYFFLQSRYRIFQHEIVLNENGNILEYKKKEIKKGE